MNDPRLPKLVFFLMLVLGLLQWAHVYRLLPNIMASHFAANGTPNGFQTKQAFFILMFVILGTSVFVSFGVPRILARQPAGRINLPNKAFWLAPERRHETVTFFRSQMGWFGCAILFVLLYGTSLAINANLSPYHKFDSVSMLYVMIGFTLFTVIWSIFFIRHFYKTPPHSVGNPHS